MSYCFVFKRGTGKVKKSKRRFSSKSAASKASRRAAKKHRSKNSVRKC